MPACLACGSSCAHKFCSRKCVFAAAKGKRPTVTAKKPCATCGDIFTPKSNRQTYCSDACRRGTSLCKVCGNTFLRTKHTTGSYCSSKCWYADDKIHTNLKVICKKCKKEFRRKGSYQQYCSKECATKAATIHSREKLCEKCQTKFYARRPSRRFCSHKCGAAWRVDGKGRATLGTVRVNDAGYAMIKIGHDYPGATAAGWMLHHRYVYQEHRRQTQPEFVLQSEEIVHHKNGNRQDNSIDNLELTIKGHKGTFKHVPGQRVEDLLRYLINRHPEIARRLMDEQ